MTSLVSRRRLLAGTALVAASLGLSSPASAQCVRSGNDLTCDTTQTVDLISDGSSPSTDRYQLLDVSAGDSTVTILPGRTVSQAGLAVDSWPTGNATLSVVNQGTVKVDSGISGVFMGGNAALSMIGNGAANLDYSGSGTISNAAGFGPDGLRMVTLGTGNLSASIGGAVTSFGNGVAVELFQGGASGNITVLNEAGGVIRSGGAGVIAGIGNSNSSGSIEITNLGLIASPTAAPGTLAVGIAAGQEAQGQVTIRNDGSLGTMSDRLTVGIRAHLYDTAQNDVTIASTGSIFATEIGIEAVTDGEGDIAVSTSAGTFSVSGGSTSAMGIMTQARSGTTDIDIGSFGLIVEGTGIQTSSSSGAQNIRIGGLVETSGSLAVQALSQIGAIGVDITTDGGIRSSGEGLFANSSGAKTVTIAAGATTEGTSAIISGGTGATLITNAGSIVANGGLSISALTVNDGAFTVANQASGFIQGAVRFSAGDDLLTNAGVVNLSVTSDFELGNDRMRNLAGGSINMAAGTSIRGLERLENAGTINAGQGLGFSDAALTLDNAGTLNLSGTLLFSTEGGTLINSGTVNAAGASAINRLNSLSNSGSFVLNGSVQFAGAGTLSNSGNFTLSGGTAKISGLSSLTNSGQFAAGGRLFFGSAADNSLLNQAGGVMTLADETIIDGLEQLSNAGTLNASGILVLEGATTALANSGTLNAAGTLNFTGGGSMTNSGTINVASSGAIRNASTFANGTNGRLNLAGQLVLAGAGTLTNAGTVSLDGSASGISGIGTLVTSNTLNVAGAIAFNGGGGFENNGSATLAAGSRVNGVSTLLNNQTLSAIGTIAFGTNGSFTNTGSATLAAGSVVNNLTALSNAGSLTIAGAVNFASGGTFTSSGIATLASGGAVNGLAALTNGNSLTVNGALAFVSGGRLDNLAAATLNASGATVQGLATLRNAGTLNLTGSMIGFSGSGTAFRNAGTLNAGTGTSTIGGLATFTNAGLFNLGGTLALAGATFANTGRINVVNGAAGLTTASLVNSGLINLEDGAANDVLTINGNYSGGTNAVVHLDYGQTASDRLVINGNVSGTTQLVLSRVPNTNQIDPAGLLLIDVSGTAGANAFTTANTSLNPLIDLSLQQRGADFFLVALPNSSGFRPLVVPNVVTDLWYQGAGMVASAPLTGDGAPRFWAQGSLSRDRYGDEAETLQAFGNSFTLSTRQRNERMGLQVGAELPLSGAAVGVTAGWQRGGSRFGGVEMIEAKGWNLGAYGRIASEAGLSASLLAKYDRNEVDLDEQLFTGLVGSPDSRSIGLSGEVGYRFGMAEVGGGLAWVRTSLDDFRAAGIAYDYEGQSSVRGHVGAKLGLEADLGAHVEGKLFREFAGDTDLTLTSGSSDTVTGRYRGTWGRIGAGIGATAKLPALVKAWADLGDVRGFGLSAGFAF